MIGLEFLRHGNRFAARIRRRYFSAERISTAGNTSAFAGYLGTNFDIFIAVSTKSFQSLKSKFYLLSNHVCRRFVGRNARNKSFYVFVFHYI